MSHWQKTPKQHKEAWDYLRSLQVDYALLQETLPPDNLDQRFCVYRSKGIGASRPWGSAVISFAASIESVQEARSRHGKTPVGLHNTFPGSVAIATTRNGLTLVSMYTVMEQGYAITTLHRQLSDLTPLLDSPIGRRVILAGDLNISTQFPEPDGTRHRNALERFQSLGMVDAFKLDRPAREPLAQCPCRDLPCRHVQTQRHSRSRTPWQNDYFFVSETLSPRVKACRAIHGGYPLPLSDHCPILMEF